MKDRKLAELIIITLLVVLGLSAVITRTFIIFSNTWEEIQSSAIYYQD